MMSASTAPPRKTMCFRRGGSSIRILNFCHHRFISPRIPHDRREGRETYAESFRIPLEHLAQMQLLHFLLESARQTRVHTRSTRQNNVLVEIRSNIDRSSLHGVEKHF